MPAVLRIKDWDTHFENAETKKVLHNPTWVKMPLKRGTGYKRLLYHKDGPALFGAWAVLVEFAMSCFVRGLLIRRDGKPYKALDIAVTTDFPVDLVERLLKLLLDPESDICWLEEISIEDAGHLITQREAEITASHTKKNSGRQPPKIEPQPDAVSQNPVTTPENGQKSALEEKREEKRIGENRRLDHPKQSSPSSAQSAQRPVRSSTGVPATWAEAAEAMKRLKISRRQAAIEDARTNGFNPPQVLALIDYLLSPAAKCESPAGALCDRLATPDASDWDMNEGWPWSKPVGSEPTSTYEPSSDAQRVHAANLEREAMDRRRQFVQELERCELAHGEMLNGMDETAVLELIATDAPATAKVIQRDYLAKGRDSPDVRPALLKLIDRLPPERQKAS